MRGKLINELWSEPKLIKVTVELLIDSLILLLHSNDELSRKLVKQLLEAYENENKNLSLADDEYIELYVTIIQQIYECSIDIRNQSAIESFLLKFKANPLVLKDPELYTTLKSIFSDISDLSVDMIKYYQTELSNTHDMYRADKCIKRMFGKLNGLHRDNDSRDRALTSIVDTCSELIQMRQQSLQDRDGSDTSIRDVDFTNKDNIQKGFDIYTNNCVKNVFRLGLQGLNRSLGGRGISLGTSLVVNARSNHGKSLTLMKIARWIVTLNSVPPEFKNPLLIYYSLENETPQNLRQLFFELYVNDKKCTPPSNMSSEAMMAYVHDQFNRCGWKFVMKRKLDANFGSEELVADFNNYKQTGFTPLVVVVDYANCMKKSETDSRDLAVRNLYKRLCNFLKYNNCCFITAHQLNRKAAELVSANPVGAVKKYNESMLSDSTDVQREVDLVLYQEKEKDAYGRTWMTFHIGKDRYNNPPVLETDKYFAYMFDPNLGIIDDVDGDDASTDNIYAVPEEGTSSENSTSASGPASFG